MKGKHQQSRAQAGKFGVRKHNAAAFMSDIAPALVATLLVLYALVSMLSVEITPDSTSAPAINSQQTVSDLGLGFAFRR